MTSPPLTLPVASAEQSSEDGRTERAPRPASGDSPLSWGHPSPLASLPYGSPYPFDLSAYPAPWVHHHHQLPQILNNSSTTRRSLPLPNLIKQTASPSKTPSTKSRRKNKSSSQPSVAPTLSTGALFTPAPNQGAPKRASSRVRTSKSSGSRALTHTRVSEVGQRLPECLWRSALHSLSADPGTSTGARVDDEGDIPLPVTSRCPHTTASENSQARLSLYNSSGVPEISGSSSAGLTSPSYDAFSNPAASESSPAGLPSPAHNSSRIPLASESGLAGLTSSSCSREHTDASIVNNSKLFVPSPSFSASEITGLRESKALRTVRPSIHISPCLSSSIPTPWSSHEPSQSSRSSGTPYGSIGVPIPSPPYQILPTPKPSASRQNPTYSLEANGYAIIRNAISPALVREVVASIDRGLPVIARSEAKQTYATTLEANKVQDEFVLVWSSISILIKVLTSFFVIEMAPCPPVFLRANGQNDSRDA